MTDTTTLNFVEGEGISIQAGPNPGDPDVTDIEIASNTAGVVVPPVDISGKVDRDAVETATARLVQVKLAAGDTQPAFKILGDGSSLWGRGGTLPLDTSLIRTATGIRANVHLRTGQELVARDTAAAQVVVGDYAGFAGLQFGSLADTQLYRSAGGVLTTPGKLISLIPACHVTHNAHQAIPNGAVTALTFNTERFDTDLIHDPAVNPTRLTCRTAGIYEIGASVEWDNSGAGVDRILMLKQGAVEVSRDRRAPKAFQTQSCATLAQLAVNDYVEVHAYQDAGGPLNVVASSSYSPGLWMTRVG
jgi:hypothetical protein